MNKKINKIIIATGGTGGHVIPAYCLAKHLVEKKINVEIISDKRGLKYLENSKEIKVNQIISTSVFKKNIFKTLFSFLVIIFSFFKSLIFLIKSRPNLVIGMGGYSSFAFCIASWIVKVPIIIYENNLYLGKSNKYLLPFASKLLVSNSELEGVEEKFRYKICIVGNILRKEVFNFKTNQKKENSDEKLKILILGGSQAAKVFGEKLPHIFSECSSKKIALKIYQQCLPHQNDFLEDFYKKKRIDFHLFNFENNIFKYFDKIDFAITRSGSSMLAELLNAQIPFISIPLPSSADNHQLKNAIYYEKKGYSFLIEEKFLKEKLINLIKIINDDKQLLNKIKDKQIKHSDKSVYENIDREINNLADEKY